MNETLLTWLVFILAFSGMVIIHELGHFIVARLCKIEVEEFGVGLPTPGALTLWINKGYLLLDDGGRIEIPSNFKLPAQWSELVDQQVKMTVDRVDGRSVLRSIEFTKTDETKQKLSPQFGVGEIYVDQNGNPVQPQNVERTTTRKTINAGKTTGEIELFDVVTETHPGTRFTLNWLPLGGFIRPKGENDPTVQGGLAAASPWRRFAVLVAGPAMNLLTAVLIYSFIFYRVGVPDTSRVMVSTVMTASPAEEAGFQGGDIFVSGNGNPIGSFDELRVIVDANAGKPVAFQVDRAGQEIELTVTPKLFQDENRVMIGVGLGVPFVRSNSIVETLGLGARYTYTSVSNLLSLPSQMIRGALTPEESRVIGLKGIFDIVGQTVSQDIEASQNASANPTAPANPMDQPVNTLNLIAALSISLGVFNLFPFPALDGGRIIFLLPELIFRRRVPAHVENLIHGLGMAVLLIFMIVVNVRDFIDPINITIP